MLINTENGLVLSDTKVIFEKAGVQEEKIIGSEGKEWWLALESKHENITILSFGTPVYEQVVLDRLEEVKTLDIDLGLAEIYVMEGKEIKGMLEFKVAEQENIISDLTQLLVDKGVIY
jgi:hypothetical protein